MNKQNDMKIYLSEIQDPYFNIAAEEFLLNQIKDNILLLYINRSSIIVGKHQNLLAEINYRYAIENNIQAVRRISGGGTVYHDLGNLNFAFISNSAEGYQIDFKKYLTIVQAVLKKFNIDAHIGGKNDLKVNDYKISGNAGHVYKNRALHHGTLLVMSDLTKLSSTLQSNANKYLSKAVPSLPSKVANLSQFNNDISINQIIEGFSYILHAPIEKLPVQFNQQIQQLVENKFVTWDWVYGYSPNYQFNTLSAALGSIFLTVEQGIIKEASIEKNNDVALKLIYQHHDFHTLKRALGLNWEHLVWEFF